MSAVAATSTEADKRFSPGVLEGKERAKVAPQEDKDTHMHCRRRGVKLSLDLPYTPHRGNRSQTHPDGDPTPVHRGL